MEDNKHLPPLSCARCIKLCLSGHHSLAGEFSVTDGEIELVTDGAGFK